MPRKSPFAGADEASVAPLVALSLFALIGAGGIAFDYARLAALDTELQQAADQAALAAATQLDGQTGATTRAVAAAQSLLVNQTLFGNDGSGVAIETGQSSTSASGSVAARVTFFSSKPDAEADTNGFGAGSGNDASAKFVKVEVTGREAVYAFTPIVGALRSGMIDAAATAGIGSAICKVPPLMICNPKPGQPFDADALKGVGIQVTGHGNEKGGKEVAVSHWSPGDFGFLAVGAGKNSDLVYALASQSLSLSCYQTDTGEVTTGNPQAVYDAINTRFDVYDFNAGALKGCLDDPDLCPSASNTIKDVFRQNTSIKNKNASECGISNPGTKNPSNWMPLSTPDDFTTKAYAATDNPNTTYDPDGTKGMGLPRDNCHYISYNLPCSQVNGTLGTSYQTTRFGDGKWARADYWATNHKGQTPPTDWRTMSRYETYRWEIENKRITSGVAAAGGLKQYGAPVCSSGAVTPGTDRRVISVAMVTNCADLAGGSLKVAIGDWVDMFLVEPTLDSRGNGSSKDSIYMEVIGKTRGTGTATQSAQTVRRDVPYLVR